MLKLLSICLVVRLITSCSESGGSIGALATSDVKWTTDEIVASRVTCVAAAKESSSTVTDTMSQVYCSCSLEEASKRWKYDDYLAHETSYTQILRDDGTLEKCANLAGITTNTTDSGSTETSTATSNEIVTTSSPDTTSILNSVTLIGCPTGINRTTQLNISVSDALSYRYKVGAASLTDCASSTDYGPEISVNTLITDSLVALADGLVRVCVIGKNSAGWQQFNNATGFTWTKDVTAPSTPSSAAVASSSPTSLNVSWTGTLSSGDYFLVVRKSGSATSWTLNSGTLYSTGQNDGSGSSVVYVGTATNFADSSLTMDNLYYYSVFKADSLHNISSSTSASGRPVRTWSSPVVIGEANAVPFYSSGYTESPKIGIDDNGNTIVAWLRHSSERHVWANIYTNGVGWGAPAAIESAAQDAYTPRVVMNGAGKGAVIWDQNSTIQVKRYDSGWSAVESAGNKSAQSTGAGIDTVIDSSGSITVLYTSGSSNNQIVATRYTSSSGWSGGIVLHTLSSSTAGAITGVDGSGNVMAVWSHNGNAYFSKNTTSWSSYAVIGISAWGVKSVKCDSSGNCLLLYTKGDSNSQLSLAAARYTPSGGWTDMGLLENDTTYPILLSISPLAISSNGQATAIWLQQYDIVNYGVFYANFSPDTGWTARAMVESINHNTGSAPFVSGYGSGNAIASWTGGSTSNTYDTGKSARFIRGQGWTAIESMGEQDFSTPIFTANSVGNGLFLFTRWNIQKFKSTRYFP